MKYKIILFDADRTLFDYDKAQENALQNTYDYFNLGFNESELQRYRVINDHLWSDLEKAIFEYTLNKIGHGDKRSVLMVGDSLSSDIQGGINAGIDTCWYNNQGEERNPKIIPTYEIKELEELLTLL